ncbi:MAG TPA: XrtA system polysaccharide deacetylase [Gammaproteobacteria bacterium]
MLPKDVTSVCGETINALSIDVEDYFQVAAFSRHVGYEEWDAWNARYSRVVQNTRKILDIFDSRNVKGTFFVLGWVAERHPGLVKEIEKRGHEIGCHGYSHQLIYKQSRKVFRQETLRAMGLLQDLSQSPVEGYRAASFSICRRSEWALDILHEAGFKYDSSIFPIRHDLYGMPGAPRVPYRISTGCGGKLVEFPMTTHRIMGWRMPVSGGGYFRLFPYCLTRHALKTINKRDKVPFMFYLHPWEIDPEQPRIPAGLLSRFRHYNNLGRCRERLEKLLDDFTFSAVGDVLRRQALLN